MMPQRRVIRTAVDAEALEDDAIRARGPCGERGTSVTVPSRLIGRAEYGRNGVERAHAVGGRNQILEPLSESTSSSPPNMPNMKAAIGVNPQGSFPGGSSDAGHAPRS